jgi:phosphoenolpyruvate phosphomutase-like protein
MGRRLAQRLAERRVGVLNADPAEGRSPPRSDRPRESYVDAGADGIFVPDLTGEAAISTLVGAVEVPLNILFSPGGPSYRRMGELGVRRSAAVPCSSGPLDIAVRTACAIAASEPVAVEVIGYAEVRALS